MPGDAMHHARRPLAAAAFALVAVVAGVAAHGRAVAAQPAPSRPQILLFVNHHLQDFLWAVRPDGSRLQRLAPACLVVPSPAGTHVIVRSSDPHSSGGCWGGWHVLRSDGTSRRHVGGEEVFGVAWSPRGDRFLLNESGTLSVFAADGSERRELFAGARGEPAWAPDGRHAVTPYAAARSAISKSTGDAARWDPILTAADAVLGQPDWAPDGTRLAFTRRARDPGEDARDTDVYVAHGDGTNAVALAASGGDDVEPAFSRDGTRIAFASDRSGNFDVYVADADGSDVVRVTTNAADERAPTWSPDGTKLAIQTRQFGAAEIAIIDLATTAVTRLTNESAAAANPDWSPDGTQIAYGLEGRIAVIAADGTGRRILPLSQAATPRWSADSRRLVFATDEDIRTVAADGSDARVVVRGTSVAPTWSPDGTITFAVQRETIRLELVDVETGEHTPLALPHVGHEERPAWSPDGSSLSFFRDGRLVIRDVRTGHERRYDVWSPRFQGAAWSPRGSTLAFEDRAVLYAVASGEPVRLTPPKIALAGTWAWSPEGTQIAFTGRPRGRSYTEIYVVDVSSTRVRRVTTSRAGEASVDPSWDAEGRRIAYGTCRFPARVFSCDSDIAVVPARGGGSRMVTSPIRLAGSNRAVIWATAKLRPGRSPRLGHASLVRPRTVLRAAGVVGVVSGAGHVAALTRSGRGPTTCARLVIDPHGPTQPRTIACQSELELAAFGGETFAWVGWSCLFAVELARLHGTPTRCRENEPLRYPVLSRPNWRVSGLAGDGDVLVFSEEPVTRRGGPIQIFRLVGRTRTRINTSPTGHVADVNGRRIALIVPGPAVRVINLDGSSIALLRPRDPRFSNFTARAVLDGDTVVLAADDVVEVHNLWSRKLVTRRTVRSPGWLQPTLVGAHEGIAVYSASSAVHLLDLRTGRRAMLRIAGTAPPYAAALGDDGLYVSYNLMRVRGGGRVGHVPFGELADAVGR